MHWVNEIVKELGAEGHGITEPRKNLLRRIDSDTRPFSAEEPYPDIQHSNDTMAPAAV